MGLAVVAGRCDNSRMTSAFPDKVLRRFSFGLSARLLLFAVFAVATCRARSFTAGDILVSEFFNGTLAEYTATGMLVQQFQIPITPGDFFNSMRGVAVDQSGRAQIYNGTFGADLVTLDPASGVIQNHAFPGWSTVNNITFGGIAVSGNYAFVTDMATFGHNDADLVHGLVRFNLADYSATRFTTRDGYQQLTIGVDGLLYALPGEATPANHIDVFDPTTLAFVRSISLSTQGFLADLRSIAVDTGGNIFAVGIGSANLMEFDPEGQLIKTQRVTDTGLTSIALDAAGELIASDELGGIFVASTDLDPLTSFHICCFSGQVAFTNPSGGLALNSSAPEPAAAALMLLGVSALLVALKNAKRSHCMPLTKTAEAAPLK